MVLRLPVFLRRFWFPVVGVLFLFVLLRVTVPEPARIAFDSPVPASDPTVSESVSLADRLVPVHALAVCLENLAARITVDSDAAFEVFDHAYRDECRSPIAGDSQWRVAAAWFGEPFLPAVHGILDSERDLVVRAVRDDAAAGRPLRAAMLWRSALGSMAARLRELARLLVLAYSPAPPQSVATPAES